MMDAERRRQLLEELLAISEATPEDIAGPIAYSVVDLLEDVAALQGIEARFLDELLQAAELGLRLGRFLDDEMVRNGGGWRFPKPQERRADEALGILDLFKRFRVANSP